MRSRSRGPSARSTKVTAFEDGRKAGEDILTPSRRSPNVERADDAEDDHPPDRRTGRMRIQHDGTADEIDIVVSQIKRLSRTASLEFALRVGAVVIHHFYDGDMQAWRSRGPKLTSFRRLASHPDLPLSPGALYRCVAIFELCDRLNAASRWEHLGASHLRLVLGLPAAKQEKLLSIANTERWTVKALERAALDEKASKPTLKGRRPEPPVTRGLRAVTKTLTEYEEVVQQADQLSRDDVEQSIRMIERTQRVLERLKRSLGTKRE